MACKKSRVRIPSAPMKSTGCADRQCFLSGRSGQETFLPAASVVGTLETTGDIPSKDQAEDGASTSVSVR